MEKKQDAQIPSDTALRDMFLLGKIAKGVGEKILKLRDSGFQISDVEEYKGHDSSTIDHYARDAMQTLIDQYLPEHEGTIRFELRPYSKTLIEQSDHENRVLIIDEIEGTTNTKRCMASPLDYRPHAAVTIAIGTGPSLADVYASAIYTMDQQEVYMSQKTGSGFNTYRNREIINPSEIENTLGDSKNRILVIGYSNSFRIEKGRVEQLLCNKGFMIYDGCRASTVDIINIIRNSYDAYIDLRAFWSNKKDGIEKEAMLQIYDIAAVIPCAVGCDLVVTDALGESWMNYGQEDTIPLIVSRKNIHSEIIEIISPIIQEWKSNT